MSDQLNAFAGASPMPLSLSDDELDQVMRATGPLQPKARSEFLTALAQQLEQQPQRGPGAIYRACRDLQKKYFDPPDLSPGKYD